MYTHTYLSLYVYEYIYIYIICSPGTRAWRRSARQARRRGTAEVADGIGPPRPRPQQFSKIVVSNSV